MASATPQRFACAETAAAVDTACSATESLDLSEINHRVAEVGALDFGIIETALHQHRVREIRSAKVGVIEAAGKRHNVLQVGPTQISALKLGGVDHCTTQVCFTQVDLTQICLQKLLLLQIATMHVGGDVLNGSLTTQFGGCDRFSGPDVNHDTNRNKKTAEQRRGDAADEG